MHPTGESPLPVYELWPKGTIVKDDYRIEQRLGGGGFGTVYLARHRYLDTLHVIKRLHQQFAEDQEFVGKFINEGRTIRRLRACPNIIAVEHMTQTADGQLILIMEHIPGGDLAGLMKSRALSIAEVIEFARQIAVALDAAHSAGVIHRDIKPANVLLGNDASGKLLLKLIDFGIAADHGSAVRQNTSVMRGGSVGYAAPEQWSLPGKELTGRADLYALGATIYQMLTGRMPFDGVTAVGHWFEEVRRRTPDPPKKLRPDTPQPLSNLVLQLLAVDPASRPANAREVARRLDALMGGTPAGAALAGDSDATKLRKVTRNSRPLWIGTGLITAALAIGLSMWKAWPPTANADHKNQEAPSQVLAPAVSQQSPATPDPSPKMTARRSTAQKVRAEKPATAISAYQADPPPPPQPVVDHVALGDQARNSGDYLTAVHEYRAASDAGKIAAVQRAVEQEVEERADSLANRGRYAEAINLADQWLREFPASQRLEKEKAKVTRARDSQ